MDDYYSDNQPRLIHCKFCGEDYAATYKACPFCHTAPNGKNVGSRSGRNSRAGNRVRTNTRGGGYGGARSPLSIIGIILSIVLLVAAVVIVVVLLFTSKSYMEVPVYLIVFAVAAVLNMGTNFIFGTISFITKSIAVVLQLALAIDYAIIFCHRYMEERDNGLSPREADIAALSKAIVEISSSSLTTISGLIALMLMQLRIGFDMGIVLSKGIVCSMLCVFLLMPGLLMLFSGPIDRTRHRSLVPKINFWGKAIVRLRYVLPPVFLVVVVAGAVLSSRCDYVFDANDTDFDNMHRDHSQRLQCWHLGMPFESV